MSVALGPVLWQLSIPDGMLTKTDKSKLLQFLESHNEPTIDWPSSDAHTIDDNAILQSFTAILVTFVEQKESVFNQSPKAEHVGFVTDIYIYSV